MSRYLLWLVVILLLTGCRTPQKITDNQEVKAADKTQVATHETQKSKSEVEVNTSTVTAKSENVVTTTKVTEYDTGKPINPDTGKPPVKSETETMQTISRGEKTQENTVTARADTTAYQKDDNSRKDVDVEVQQEHSEKRQLPTIVWWAVSIVAVGVLVLVFWSKLTGWFSKIGGWIKGLFKIK